MAIAWRREPRPRLQTQPWRVITLGTSEKDGEGRKYLVKGLFDDAGYHVMLSDSCAVWEESIEASKVLERLKKLNPKVEAPLSILQNTLSSHLECQQAQATYILTSQPQSSIIQTHPPHATPTPPPSSFPEEVTLTIQTMLTSLPLDWKFICKKCSLDKLSSQLVVPLLTMVGELQRRQQELCEILVRKDKEIQDFKDQGHRVTRKYLETAPFSLKGFENEMITSSGFEETGQLDVDIFSDPSCQRLYKDITMLKRWIANKDENPAMDPAGLEASGTTGTWVAKIPASLLPSIPPSQAQKSPTSSPAAKRPPPPLEESPLQDSEQHRRAALERKLEENKNKSKKKKKKLI